jgi:hypothetical protein
MATNQSLPTVADFPPELTTAVMADAARDADRVGQFLVALGLRLDPKTPLPLPARFLRYLAAALRLLSWEAQGFSFHREHGLPAAGEVIHAAFRSLNDPHADPTELCIGVMRLSVEKFAWTAPTELGVDVSLGDAEDELLLEALADFLWAHRVR